MERQPPSHSADRQRESVLHLPVSRWIRALRSPRLLPLGAERVRQEQASPPGIGKFDIHRPIRISARRVTAGVGHATAGHRHKPAARFEHVRIGKISPAGGKRGVKRSEGCIPA